MTGLWSERWGIHGPPHGLHGMDILVGGHCLSMVVKTMLRSPGESGELDSE